MAGDDAIRALVELGDTVAAVRLHRERHGGSLVDARAAVEAIRWSITQARGRELGGLEREVDELLRRADTLGAIRRWREATGCSLKAASEAIEARKASSPATTAPDLNDVEAAIRGGHKILAIKQYRERTGCSLVAARDHVEARMRALEAPPPPPRFDPPDVNGLQPELDRLIGEGQYIPAVEHYQARVGASVHDAIAAVEARRLTLTRAAPDARADARDDGLQPELDRLIRAGELIQAIKHHRQITGRGLKECKDAVEARRAELGL